MLERRVGGGGMAEVYLAHTIGAEGFTRRVAIKRVLSGLAENPRFAQMFVSEAQLSSRLQHPNVVMVLDFDRDDEGRPFLVMEHVDGPDLAGLLATGMLPVSATIHIIGEVLRGLGYAHDLPAGTDGVRGLVHRDVSPHNVLLSWEGAVKVSDFGIAKAREASNATASEMIKGKPAYMSPEQANGEPIDGRSDLFATGVILWEMLCGRELFSGTTTQETLARLMFAPIPSPRELRPQVAADLAAVTMRLLARDRAARYPNANTALAELVACGDHPRSGRELLGELLGERFPNRAPQRAPGSREVVPTVETPSEPPRALPRPMDARPDRIPAIDRARPSRRRWFVLAGVLVALAAGAITIASQRGDAASRGAAPIVALVDAGPTSPPVPPPTPDAAPPAPDAGTATAPRADAGTRPPAKRGGWPDLSLVPSPSQASQPDVYLLGKILIAGGDHAKKKCRGRDAEATYRATLLLVPTGKAHSVEVTPADEYGDCLAKILRAGRYPEYAGGPFEHEIIY